MKQFAIMALLVLVGIGAFFYFTMKTPAAVPPAAPSLSTTTVPSIPAISSVTYQSDQFGFTFNYPANIQPTSTFATSYLALGDWSLTASFDSTAGNSVVAVELPDSDELKAGELRIGVSTSSTAVKDCLIPPSQSGSSPTSTVSIQGQPFMLFSMNDAAMSHQLEAKIYRAVHNDACYSIEAVVTGTNPEVYNPPRTVPFTSSMAFDALDAMIQSFSFAAPQTTVEVQ